MSGGTWNYAQYQIEEWAQFMKDSMNLLAKLEHIVDWAEAGDTSKEKAQAHVYSELVRFFDEHFASLHDDNIH